MALNESTSSSPSKFKYHDSDAMREITKYHAIITARAANWAVMKQAYIDCGLLLQTQHFSPNIPTVVVNLLKAAKNKLETDKNANLQLILLEFVGYLGKSATSNNIIQYNHIIMPTLMAFTNSKQRQFITVLYNALDSWCHYEEQGMKDYSIFNSIMPYICNAINMTNIYIYIYLLLISLLCSFISSFLFSLFLFFLLFFSLLVLLFFYNYLFIVL